MEIDVRTIDEASYNRLIAELNGLRQMESAMRRERDAATARVVELQKGWEADAAARAEDLDAALVREKELRARIAERVFSYIDDNKDLDGGLHVTADEMRDVVEQT